MSAFIPAAVPNSAAFEAMFTAIASFYVATSEDIYFNSPVRQTWRTTIDKGMLVRLFFAEVSARSA